MDKAVPFFTIQRYISCTLLIKFQLLIDLENSQNLCFKTKTKTAEFRS